MKLVAQARLIPDAAQAERLTATMARFNEAANWVAGEAFARRTANKIDLQRTCYREVRERFGLSSQMTILCIHRVCEAYKRDKDIQPEFRPDAAITYDVRTLSYKADDRASLLTLEGRVVVPYRIGEHQRGLLAHPRKQADLVHRKDGKWFLIVTVEVAEPQPIEPSDVLGVDLGIARLATDSDGEAFTGEGVDAVRRRYSGRRRTLNKVGTKSARRRLSKIRHREANYRRDTNHVISKRLVAKAKATGSAIALEDLGGIRDRVSVKKPQRSRHHGWAFFQLRTFIEYKARREGIPVVLVDPRNTSRTCSACGHCEKANRRGQAEFACRACGHAMNADENAARNLRAKALVMAPTVGVDDAGPRNPAETAYKPPRFSVCGS